MLQIPFPSLNPKGSRKPPRNPRAITTLQPEAPELRAQRPYARLGPGVSRGRCASITHREARAAGAEGRGRGATPPNPVGPCPPAEAPPSPDSAAQSPQTKLRWLAGVLIGIKPTRQGQTHCF